MAIVGLEPMAHLVSAVSPDLVISQVYGGGGNGGAPYTHDFIELFNRGTTAVSLSGLHSHTGRRSEASPPLTGISLLGASVEHSERPN